MVTLNLTGRPGPMPRVFRFKQPLSDQIVQPIVGPKTINFHTFVYPSNRPRKQIPRSQIQANKPKFILQYIIPICFPSLFRFGQAQMK